MSKSVEHIISNLNKEIVTFSSYDFITKEVKSTTMTLESRLKATCEESFLVSGEWLAANEARFDVDDIEIEDDGIYCVSTECIYDLSSDYAKAYHTQFCEEWETDYWETIAGRHRFTKFDEETFVFS